MFPRLAYVPTVDATALMLAHGFTSALIEGLIDSGLVISTIEPILAGGRPVQLRLVRITYAGRATLQR
jgi:hypothetical protein